MHNWYKHGMFGTPEYKAWSAMIQRCSNPKDSRYYSHGGRGIKVCDEWRASFENFYKDMGDRPSDKHSLDRIDNDGNYEPTNCKWSTQSEQNFNKRISKNNTSGAKGVYRKGDKWEVWIFKDLKRIYIGKYIDLEIAIESRKQAEIKYWKNG